MNFGPRPRAALLALVALAVGCRLTPAEGNTANQGGSPNPSSLVDEDYRIRLDWPGQGWQLLAGHAAGTPSSDSGLCAYDEEQSLSGCVSVVLAPPAPLEACVTDWLNRIAYLNRSTIVRKTASFREQSAEFFEADRTYSREASHLAGVAFYYQNHVYRVVVRGPIDRFDHTRSKAFLESVHLMPGKVQDPVLQHASQAKSGLGYRVANGVYENGVRDFTIALDPSWGVIVGDALHEFDPDADVVLMHDNPEVSIAVRVEPLRHDDAALTKLQESHRRNFQVELVKDRLRMRLHEVNSAVQLGRMANGNMIAYLGYPLGDKSVELTAGFSELYRATALPAIERIANSIAIVAKNDRLAFERSVARDTPSEHRVGREYSLRRGCFREFTLGFGWCQPEGFWSFNFGDEVRAGHDGTVLRASNLSDGLTLNLFFRSRSEHERDALFESLANEYGLQAGKPVEVGFFNRVAVSPKQARKRDDESFLYSFMRGTDEIAALVTCRDAGPKCGETSRMLAKGLLLQDFGKAVAFTDRGLWDLRLGIEQQLPPSYRARSREDLLVEGGQRATWDSADSSVTLVTALSSGSSSPGDFSQSIDQITRATVPTALLRQRKSSTLMVAGEPAECQSFVGLNYRFDAIVLRHERVLLAWLIACRSSDKLREVLAGAHFLN